MNSSTAVQRRRFNDPQRLAALAGGGIDESVERYLRSLPALEGARSEAKAQCLAAERALRSKLGRRPYEMERREDEAWARAALAFKEADNALFIARSLGTWDD